MLQSVCKKRRQGGSTVELPFVAPIVLFMFLGVVELGRALMVIHLLNNAAEAGARVGVIEGKSSANITTTVNGALTAVGISSDTVSVTANDGSADASTAQAGDEITVKVSVPVGSVSWVPGMRYLSGSLQGQYTMRRE
jgi:Flp pilus assembly protein TadG